MTETQTRIRADMPASKEPNFAQTIPEGDNRLRQVCTDCGFVAYENPKVVVGAVVTAGEKILLCRRAINPRKGFWTLPAGFMELGETTAQGAARETDEEAGAHIEMGPLFSLMNVMRVGQVHMYYLAPLTDTVFNPGPESIEARLFREDEIPWDDIAFRTVRETLKRYFEDRRKGAFGFHTLDL